MVTQSPVQCVFFLHGESREWLHSYQCNVVFFYMVSHVSGYTVTSAMWCFLHGESREWLHSHQCNVGFFLHGESPSL